MEIIHHHFALLTSTNDYGKDQLNSFDKTKLTIISADEQSLARGQYGRKWISPPGDNIYASFCFFIDEQQPDPLSLTHLMALSAIHILETKQIACRIKWPNDIFTGQRKIAGILCETSHMAPHFGVVLGIGLNVNMDKETLAQISQPATSILSETGVAASPKELLEAIARHFNHNLIRFKAEGFTPFLPLFRRYIFTTAAL